MVPNCVKPLVPGSDDRLGEANRNPRVSEHLTTRRSAVLLGILRSFGMAICAAGADRPRQAGRTPDLPLTRRVVDCRAGGRVSAALQCVIMRCPNDCRTSHTSPVLFASGDA